MKEVNEFDFQLLVDLKENTKLSYDRTDKSGSYYVYNIPFSFDIETTSMYVQDEKVSFMYIWMIGIGKYSVYGRTWDDLIEFFKAIQDIFELDHFHSIYCYVHNFSYEFQFIRKYFEWINVFAVDERKPIKALCSLGIEFRDSYILSGMSLEKTAENLTYHTIPKLVGNLDYSKIRTQNTKLSKKELAYCENDVLILIAYIEEQIEQYGTITKIPLTNTGKVRKFVRENCYYTSKSHKKSNTGKYKRYRDLMKSLTIDPDEYKQLKRAFMGGFTHGNANYIGKLLEQVGSFDFTSSYPSVMLSEKFPMSSGHKIEIGSLEEFEQACKKYCLVFDVYFEDITSKISYENYLSESKCYNVHNSIVNNGRIFSADSLITTITNVDYDIIKQAYSWSKIKISNVIAYYKNYLPKPIIESVLSLYKDKTQLKGIKGKEVEYLVSKGMLNSTYGMMVTDIIRENNTYTTEWEKEPADVEKQIEKYNKGKSRFLFYPWGIFVTAYARKNLWSGILSFKDDYIYSDTDSIKCLNYEDHLEYINKYNEMVTKKFEQMATFYNIDMNEFKPKNKKGIEKPMGIWDFEGIYSRFKTLGAKRYLVEQNKELELTVAGLSKKNGLEYMIEQENGDHTKVFNSFTNQLYIPAKRTGKNTHTYIDQEKEFTCLDYQGNETHIVTLSGVHLENCDFTLSIAKEYGKFLYNLLHGYIYKGVSQTL